jgi:hypothetical protein
MNPPKPYKHVRLEDTDVLGGIYRVVGRNEATVTLLRVANSDERRIHTGEVVTVTLEEFTGFAPAENPDGNRPLGTVLRSNLEAGYWSLRVFVHQLVTNPLPTTVAVTLVITGVFGDQFLTLPEVVFGGLALLGSLSLAYVGSGRVRLKE